LFSDFRFRTAVDLYAEAPFEGKDSTRLIILATALEVLAPPTPKHQVAIQLLLGWQREAEVLAVTFAPDSEEAAALEALRRELLVRRDASIRMRIRHFVRSTLETASVADAQTIATKAVEAYDARSSLVHDGTLSSARIGASIEALRTAIEHVLVIRFAAV
jgi:hypothetical protein